MLKAGAGAPARMSPFSDPEGDASRPSSRKEYFDCMAESGKIGRPGLPQIIPVTEFRDIFGVALTNTIGGADAGDRAEEGDRGLQARAREVRAGLSLTEHRGADRSALRLLPPGPVAGPTVTADPR